MITKSSFHYSEDIYALHKLRTMHNNSHSPILEITVLSAQGLRIKSPTFFGRLRPFITITPEACSSRGEHMKIYKTRVDDKGGVNPTWGDKFQLSIDKGFFYQRFTGIYLHLYTKHLLMGKSQLGWCLIPAADISSPVFPMGSIRFLSYRLRARDGSRGHGVVNVTIRLEGTLMNSPRLLRNANATNMPELQEADQTVVGIPVTL